MSFLAIWDIVDDFGNEFREGACVSRCSKWVEISKYSHAGLRVVERMFGAAPRIVGEYARLEANPPNLETRYHTRGERGA